MYALVQWCGGSDNGKRSVVNTKKIRNFDVTKFLDGEITRGDEFAVEWGTGRAPKGGFPTYMAKVLKIADKESMLSAYNPSVMEDSDEFISEEDNEEDDRPSKRQSISKKFFDDHPTKDAPTKVALVNRNNNKDKAAAKQLQNQQIAASLSQRQGSEKDKATEEIQLLRHELQELRNFVFSELPKISQQIQEMTARPAPAPASETPLSPQYVEIYPGSGVMAPKNVCRSAMQANTGTAMARILLLGVFDIEILATSNLRGGEAKVGGKGGARQALDEVKMKAIFDAVMDRHPATTRGAIGTAVNCKLAEIRAHLAKRRRSEESESSDA